MDKFQSKPIRYPYRREARNHGCSFVDDPENSENRKEDEIKDKRSDRISAQTSYRREAKWRRAIESIKSSMFDEVNCRSRTKSRRSEE